MSSKLFLGTFCAGVTAMAAVSSAAVLTGGYTSGALGSQMIVDDIGAQTSGGANEANFNLLQYTGLTTAGNTVTITGAAVIIQSATANGTITFKFYGLGNGTPDVFNGLSGAPGVTTPETLLGSATATFSGSGTTNSYYATFDTPVTFTADSTGFAVQLTSTGALTWKQGISQPGSVLYTQAGAYQVNGTTGASLSLAGTVPEPGSLAMLGLGAAGFVGHRRKRLA